MPALMSGLAEHISAAGIATYRADAPYADDELGIVFQTMPETGTAMCISYYGSTDPTDAQIAETRLQVRWRCGEDPFAGLAVMDQLRALLHRRLYLRLGTVQVTSVRRISAGPLGNTDDRPEFVSSFGFVGLRPLPPVRDPA
ncbi:hypothetical protein D9V30_10215 [Mycetocola reblochoni]|uniref:Phage protein n=2 Tax=Mycetocola reblochoni TaxID=331618 RepID=A0A1R4JQ91_9MICO|nr:hypothetical protein D9V30_10215 [Mycetocola reblochoni]SJN34168.1 hypothetical protein FM119_08800 [Mycetocola reblochoni REB411]